jgi:copper chaperone
MIAFEVNDMTCGHCISTITKAVKAADKDAKVQIDLASHRVQVEPATADADELADAIREAGYTPVPVEAGGPVVT